MTISNLESVFSLALDLSVDIGSISFKNLLFVRICLKENIIREDFLKVIPMKGHTRSVDYFEIISIFFEKNKID